MDDKGNIGFKYSAGAGIGVEVTSKATGAFEWSNKDTIYDHRGYDGIQMSASYGLTATFDESGLNSFGGVGVGGSMSWGVSYTIGFNYAELLEELFGKRKKCKGK